MPSAAPGAYAFWLEYDPDSGSLWQLAFANSTSGNRIQLWSTDASSGETDLVYSLPCVGWTGAALSKADQYLFVIDCSLTRLFSIDLSLASVTPACGGWRWFDGGGSLTGWSDLYFFTI